MITPRKELLKDGSFVWRARGVSAGKWPNGKRRLVTITASTKKACSAEVARVTGKVADGTYVPRWDGDINAMIDAYLKSATFEREANTALSYSKALLPVRERLGIRKARSITREDIEALRDWMLTEGRRRGGKPGTGLGARSVRLTIGLLVRGVRARDPGQQAGQQPGAVRAVAEHRTAGGHDLERGAAARVPGRFRR